MADPIGNADRSFARTALLLIVAPVLAAAALHFGFVAPRARQTAIERWHRELSLNADLRQSAVERWLEDRATDANVVSRFPSVIALLEGRPEEGGRGQLAQILTDVSAEHGFVSVVAIWPNGVAVATSRGVERDALGCAAIQTPAVARGASGPVLCESEGRQLVAFSSPVVAHDEPGRTIGAVVVLVDAETWLYPFFQVRPTTVASGEAQIVARDGARVRYLTSRADRPGRRELDRRRATPELAGAAALEGRARFGRFADFRGVPVYAVTRPINGTSWGLVVKVDESDVIAEAAHAARPIGIAVMMGAALLGMIAAGVLRWQGRAARRAEHASRDLIKAIIERAPASVHAIDREGRVTLWNPGSEKIFGWSEAEVLGQPLPIVSREKQTEFGARLAQTLAGKPPEVSTVRRTRKDGSSVDLLMSVAALRGDDEEVTGALAVAIDVTSAREIEARARAVFESGLIGVVLGDIHGHVFEANDAYLCTIGYTRDELNAGKIRWDVITPPEWRHADEAGIAEARRLGHSAPYEKEYLRRDGTRVPVVIGLQLFDPDRVKSLALILDISALKNEQRARRQAESAFGALFETPAVPIAIIDEKDGLTFVECNAAYAAKLGQSVSAVSGRKLDDLELDDEILRGLRASAVELAAAGGSSVFETDVREEGILRRYVVSMTRVVAPPPGGGRLLVVLTDVTSLRRVEVELRRLNEELERRVADRTEELRAANEELESFSYTVSHDLRAPLRAISGFSALVEEEYSDRIDAEGRRLLSVIRGATRSMGQLIDDLLAFSRAGRKVIERASVPMAKIAHAAWMESPEQRRSRAELVLGKLPDAQGDSALLRQLWFNLLDNALKYSATRECPRIEIGHTRANGGDCWFVRDNGVGFDMQYAAKLFGVFQRLHSSQEFEGTGVGLAIVQRVVQRHGGVVWAEAEPDRGATFYFTLGD